MPVERGNQSGTKMEHAGHPSDLIGGDQFNKTSLAVGERGVFGDLQTPAVAEAVQLRPSISLGMQGELY